MATWKPRRAGGIPSPFSGYGRPSAETTDQRRLHMYISVGVLALILIIVLLIILL
jgi:hypothetical protein